MKSIGMKVKFPFHNTLDPVGVVDDDGDKTDGVCG